MSPAGTSDWNREWVELQSKDENRCESFYGSHLSRQLDAVFDGISFFFFFGRFPVETNLMAKLN